MIGKKMSVTELEKVNTGTNPATLLPLLLLLLLVLKLLVMLVLMLLLLLVLMLLVMLTAEEGGVLKVTAAAAPLHLLTLGIS